MPTYEYVCEACQHAWESIQSMSEEPEKICPQCKKETAKRQISTTSFILKGGGWASEGYK